MHVLYLTEEAITFSGPQVRGGAIHARRVVEGLRERGHDVTLVDWNASPERPYQFSVSPRSRFFDGATRTFLRSLSLGRSTGIDVVVSKTRKTQLAGLAATRLLGVPHVVHVGTTLSPVAGASAIDRLDILSFDLRLRAPHDGYLVVCEYIRDQLVARGVSENCIYDVKNAVDTGAFDPGNVAPHPELAQVERDDPVVGFVGGLHDYKGVLDLLDAVERMDEQVHLAVAGDGPECKAVEQGLGDHGTFLGAVPYEDIPSVYAALDVFVLPSHSEGLPRSILEAQAMGTPVVATTVGGVPELLEDGETGLLCPAGDPSALADRLDTLVGDPELAARLERVGRERVREGYEWDRLFDRYDRALQGILSD